jgi:hypothetical protein
MSMTLLQFYAITAPIGLGLVGLLIGWRGIANVRRNKARDGAKREALRQHLAE